MIYTHWKRHRPSRLAAGCDAPRGRPTNPLAHPHVDGHLAIRLAPQNPLDT